MSKPRKHLSDRNGLARCGRIVLDKTSIVKSRDEVTCPQCKRDMHEEEEYQFDEQSHPDPEITEAL